MSNKAKYILFDFDGVIIDSFNLALETSRLWHSELEAKEYRTWFHGNIYGHGSVTDESTNHFFANYVPKMITQPYVQGMEKVIRALGQEYKLLIVSSTTTEPIKEYLKRHQLQNYFVEVLGADVERSKIKKFKMIFNNYSANAKNYIFITDTLGDLREAKQAGIAALAVTWGYNDRAALEQGNPFAIVQTPNEILGHVARHFTNLSAPGGQS